MDLVHRENDPNCDCFRCFDARSSFLDPGSVSQPELSDTSNPVVSAQWLNASNLDFSNSDTNTPGNMTSITGNSRCNDTQNSTDIDMDVTKQGDPIVLQPDEDDYHAQPYGGDINNQGNTSIPSSETPSQYWMNNDMWAKYTTPASYQLNKRRPRGDDDVNTNSEYSPICGTDRPLFKEPNPHNNFEIGNTQPAFLHTLYNNNTHVVGGGPNTEQTNSSTAVRSKHIAALNPAVLSRSPVNATPSQLLLYHTNAAPLTAPTHGDSTGDSVNENVRGGNGSVLRTFDHYVAHALATTSPLPPQDAFASPTSTIVINQGVYSGESSPVSSTNNLPTRTPRDRPRAGLSPLSNNTAVYKSAASSPAVSSGINSRAGTAAALPLSTRVQTLKMDASSPSSTPGSMTPETRADITSLLPIDYDSDVPSSPLPALSTQTAAAQPPSTPATSAPITPQPSNNQNYSRAAFSDDQLRLAFDRANDGLKYIYVRVKLQLTNDDVQQVKNNKLGHIFDVKKALLKLGYKPAPDSRVKLTTTLDSKTVTTGKPKNKPKKTKEQYPELKANEIAEWKRWNGLQAEQLVIAHTVEGNVLRAEAYAWQIVEEVIEVHQSGWICNRFEADDKMTCSARLAMIIKMIEDYPIIRMKMFQNDLNIKQFAAHPVRYASAKIENLWSNFKRKKSGETENKRGVIGSLNTIFLTHMNTQDADKKYKEYLDSLPESSKPPKRVRKKSATQVENGKGKGKAQMKKVAWEYDESNEVEAVDGADDLVGGYMGDEDDIDDDLAADDAAEKIIEDVAGEDQYEEDEFEDGIEDAELEGEMDDGSQMANLSTTFVKDEEDDPDNITVARHKFPPKAPATRARAAALTSKPETTPQKRARSDAMKADRDDAGPRTLYDSKFASPDFDEIIVSKKRKLSPPKTKKSPAKGLSISNPIHLE